MPTRLWTVRAKIPGDLRVFPQQYERGGTELVVRPLHVKQKAVLDEGNRGRIRVC